MDAIEALRTRRSVRKYAPTPVKQEDLETILDCGRLAPTAINRQSWRFVAVTDPMLKQKIADLMEYGKHIADAGACIAVFTGPECFGAHEDSCAATTCMLMAAHALGYAGCWIGCHDNPSYPKIAKLLGAPEGFTMMSLFSVGAPAGDPPKPAKRELADVASYNGF